MGERAFGPYRLVRQIAVGGMAEIHLAKTKGIAGFEKYVALKMIHPNFSEDEQFIQMLVDEAKISVQLNHGNIAQTFDLGRVGDTFYITMEYVDGADLYKLLRKGSEIDVEVPLDVAAFVGKEIASALDHAHRKKDHTGKSLGIVHRDVSPQNVLISFSGEVKLVDFGIAKATMKARQTAVGVIKGKYYYMSPEQAWGDPIDYRSDIFSAGIVLYEMITGQMLYLEEDLHKLLDMARRADIAPPSKLRKGVPPQLERIVMHALAKAKEDRYQSASDFASDLERFLHAYSPVFTAAKLATLLKRVVGDPTEVPDADDIEMEVRDGPISTHTLEPKDLIHDKEEIRDENSVIFRVAELQPPPKPPPRPRTPSQPVPRVTRPADPVPQAKPIARVPPIKAPAARPAPPAPPRAPTRPRDPREDTRPTAAAPPGPTEESGLLSVAEPPAPAWNDVSTEPGEDLENIGERTMITAPSGMGGGFMMDVAGEDGVEATLISQGPPQPETSDATTDDDEDAPTLGGSDEDGPTLQRDPFPPPQQQARRTAPRGSAQPPAALAGKIHAPAVSEIRKPRPSRKTPAGGVPGGNIMQAIVSSAASEPMPTPRLPARQITADAIAAREPRPEDSNATTLPPADSPARLAVTANEPQHQQMPQSMPNGQLPPGYAHDASGMPIIGPTPPPGMPVQLAPNVPPHLQPYAMQHPGQSQPMPAWNPQQPYGQPYPQYNQMSPNAMYAYQPGPPQPNALSVTGQLRLLEADELPSHFKLSDSRWIKIVIAGVLAVSVAAGVTFFILRSMRDVAPLDGSIHIVSNPPGAEIYVDGTKMKLPTPNTIEHFELGTHHTVRVQKAGYKSYEEVVDIPKNGGEVHVAAALTLVTGKILVDSQPSGADIFINNEPRGRTPTTLTDIDIRSAQTIEIRLKGYKAYVQKLEWPASSEIAISTKLIPSH